MLPVLPVLHGAMVHVLVLAVLGAVWTTAQVWRLGAFASIVAVHADIEQLHGGPIQDRIHHVQIGHVDADTRPRKLIPDPANRLGQFGSGHTADCQHVGVGR
ncbi:hypothetical protein [Mycobacterium intracellulare]|uniref:hypothetical protein n=1 Tax=Mycobacterium intracellulare TaxID=1767 RepID=UPI001CDA3098|nr:hypothetical protein [Mycobacterium intracellulare]